MYVNTLLDNARTHSSQQAEKQKFAVENEPTFDANNYQFYSHHFVQ